MCLIQSPRWVVVMPPLLGALLSGNCPLFDWVEVVLASGALVSTSCPCLVDPALAGLLQLLLLLLGAAMSAAVVAVVAQGYPIDRSVPLLGPWVGLVLAVAPTKTRTGRALVAVLLGRAAAIAGTACLFLCSIPEGLSKGANRLLCRRRPRRIGSVVEGWCSVMWWL
jgi:hypothetical protein